MPFGNYFWGQPEADVLSADNFPEQWTDEPDVEPEAEDTWKQEPLEETLRRDIMQLRQEKEELQKRLDHGYTAYEEKDQELKRVREEGSTAFNKLKDEGDKAFKILVQTKRDQDQYIKRLTEACDAATMEAETLQAELASCQKGVTALIYHKNKLQRQNLELRRQLMTLRKSPALATQPAALQGGYLDVKPESGTSTSADSALGEF